MKNYVQIFSKYDCVYYFEFPTLNDAKKFADATIENYKNHRTAITPPYEFSPYYVIAVQKNKNFKSSRVFLNYVESEEFTGLNILSSGEIVSSYLIDVNYCNNFFK